MIRLHDVALPGVIAAKLRDYQDDVDAKPTYAERVAGAKRLFKSRNVKSNTAFKVIRQKLDEMCSGARRCAYCEDSAADEVEHVRPKDLYPEHVFRWENYVYACGPCNGPKGNGFALFEAGTGQFRDVKRKPGDPVVPPAAGDDVLIDPRSENPLDYLELDLAGTFLFLSVPGGDQRTTKRAEYTIELLRLNERDLLIDARRQAFGSYVARLHRYRQRKADGADAAELDQLADGIRSMSHPTVWQEMKRQQDLHRELRKLFKDVPEALDW